MNSQAKWLLNWFKKRGPIPRATIKEQLQINYFEANLIDSLGVIELITDVEDHFDIRFDERHFQDRRIATIGGLSGLITEISNSEK